MGRYSSDYVLGCHPRVLEAIKKYNSTPYAGYGEDERCASAAEIIKKLCGRKDIDVHFLVGGTQTNRTVLTAMLRPHEGVIACESGHINVHETGAIEASGHKVIALPAVGGKLTPKSLDAYCAKINGDATREHMVKPAAVYISNTTETGTVYNADELRALRSVCDKWGLYLFLDGARLGYAMACEPSVTFGLLCEVCDVFYIGGTKQGALFGEAVVIVNDRIKPDFRYHMKQSGAMLAKGFLLGIQFEELLKDGLYGEIAENAIVQARRIREAAVSRGYGIYGDSPSNQQFIIMDDAKAAYMNQKYACEYIEKTPGANVMRFCTSWATTAEEVDELINDL